MPLSPAAGRTLTILAAAFLAFDGAALAGLGLWAGRTPLVLAGLVFFLSSGLVLVYWRRQRRRLEEITAARRELGDEARALRKLLGG
ncbi:MAG: hypothetical protein ACREMX_06960 [Gemmatimonadales bacterium]